MLLNRLSFENDAKSRKKCSEVSVRQNGHFLSDVHFWEIMIFTIVTYARYNMR